MSETAPVSPAAVSSPAGIALNINNLSKTFQLGSRRIEALSGISFTVRRGAVAGLIGPDAAGKTTLMRLAAGLLKPDEGSITALGMDAVREPLLVQSAIGYMPQRFGLYEDLTVHENLELYADLQGVAHAERSARYGELMRMANLTPFMKRLAGQLSGGMKQKLGLACALVRKPELLLLDEPTVGVDPLSRRELWNIVYRLVKEHGTSVLISTAYLDEAERCDEVILLHEGQLLAQGAPVDLRQTMQGRSFKLRSEQIDKRALQSRVSEHPKVMDALIQGDAVRIVMHEGATPKDLLPAQIEWAATPVAPRFEDCFVALLKEKSGAAAPAVQRPLAASRKIEGGEPVIEVSRLSRRFGNFYAVDGISFMVKRGEVFGLLGANGAGKSTTFRMLCGLLPASSGELLVAGKNLRHSRASARTHIGYMSQKFSLYGNLSLLENLRFFSRIYGLKGNSGNARIAWALKEFELQDITDMISGDLSVGHKQRLALACALMHEPEIIFLDEPTSGVDPLARREFWARINDLAAQGVTVMVTTHFMEEAEYCDRLAIMAKGRILTLGTPSGIKADAQNADAPEPTMEDAFINLIVAHEAREAAQ